MADKAIQLPLSMVLCTSMEGGLPLIRRRKRIRGVSALQRDRKADVNSYR